MSGMSFQEMLDIVLVTIAGRGDARKVLELLSQGARVDARDQGFTPLLAAAQFGHTEVCKLLLETGKANIEETGPYGHTALRIAANKGHSSTVAMLLSQGARVDSRDEEGNTPLLAAAQEGHTEVCELLLANGSDLEVKSPKTRFTALIYAALNGDQSLLQLLISHKADVNSGDGREGTPLHCASQEGHLASVVTLLQAGADPLLPHSNGGLPIHFAATKNHHEVVRILIEQGGCSPDQVRHTYNAVSDHLESLSASVTKILTLCRIENIFS